MFTKIEKLLFQMAEIRSGGYGRVNFSPKLFPKGTFHAAVVMSP